MRVESPRLTRLVIDVESVMIIKIGRRLAHVYWVWAQKRTGCMEVCCFRTERAHSLELSESPTMMETVDASRLQEVNFVSARTVESTCGCSGYRAPGCARESEPFYLAIYSTVRCWLPGPEGGTLYGSKH